MLVFVHSPFTSADVWAPVADWMKRDGHDVRVPPLQSALVDPGARPLYPRLVRTICDAARGREFAVLVAHSGAGPLMAAVAAESDNVAGVVFVDAGLPRPGAKWRDTAPPDLVARLLAGSKEGRLPAWSTWFGPDALGVLLPDEDARERFRAAEPRAPVVLIEEPFPDDELSSAMPAAYLRLGRAYDAELASAQRLGWPTRTADLGHLGRVVHRGQTPMNHLGMLTAPERVAALLDELIGEIT